MTLRVTVEVVPGGDEARKRSLAVVDVSNVSDGAKEICDYEVEAVFPEASLRRRERVRVVGHQRCTGWMPLVRRVLDVLERKVRASG